MKLVVKWIEEVRMGHIVSIYEDEEQLKSSFTTVLLTLFLLGVVNSLKIVNGKLHKKF